MTDLLRQIAATQIDRLLARRVEVMEAVDNLPGQSRMTPEQAEQFDELHEEWVRINVALQSHGL